MARPIRETPVLKGEDAFNFEMRRLEVEHMSKEQRAENRRKLEEQVAEAKILFGSSDKCIGNQQINE